VGGGIAGLSAAAFLVRDAQMPGKNITVYDQLPVFGGSMDACGNAETELYFQRRARAGAIHGMLWDLFSTIPSIYEKVALYWMMKLGNAIRNMKLTPSIGCTEKV
jgi:oleate hydratase